MKTFVDWIKKYWGSPKPIDEQATDMGLSRDTIFLWSQKAQDIAAKWWDEKHAFPTMDDVISVWTAQYPNPKFRLDPFGNPVPLRVGPDGQPVKFLTELTVPELVDAIADGVAKRIGK